MFNKDELIKKYCLSVPSDFDFREYIRNNLPVIPISYPTGYPEDKKMHGLPEMHIASLIDELIANHYVHNLFWNAMRVLNWFRHSNKDEFYSNFDTWTMAELKSAIEFYAFINMYDIDKKEYFDIERNIWATMMISKSKMFKYDENKIPDTNPLIKSLIDDKDKVSVSETVKKYATDYSQDYKLLNRILHNCYLPSVYAKKHIDRFCETAKKLDIDLFLLSLKYIDSDDEKLIFCYIMVLDIRSKS